MNKFIIFKKQEGEIENSYSLVNEDIIKTIPTEIIYKVVDVEDKLYTKEELEELRKENV